MVLLNTLSLQVEGDLSCDKATFRVVSPPLCALPGWHFSEVSNACRGSDTVKNRKITPSYDRNLYIYIFMYYMDCILCIVFYELYSMHCILQIVFYRLYSTDCILQIIFYRLYSTDCILQIVFYRLYYMHYILSHAKFGNPLQ